MKPVFRYAWMGVTALLATLAGVYVAERIQAEATDGRPAHDKVQATKQLLALTLPDTLAMNQSLSQWRGKILVVNFWATWCTPCREEMPAFSRLHQKFAGKGVQFVGIAFDNADKVQKFSLETPVSYPLLIGTTGLLPIMAGLGNLAGGLPFTVLVDRKGNLLETRLGIWKESAFEAILADLTR
ncbi:MAG: TlpA disulfide reductase family protein [Sterolibacterium sp.]